MEEKSLISIVSPPKRLGWLIHIIGWGIVLIFPFVFVGRNSESVSWFDYLRFVTILSGVIIVFYANYLYLVKRFLFTRQRGWYLFSNFILFTCVIILLHFTMNQIPPNPHFENMRPPRPEPSPEHQVMFIFFDYVKYTLVAAVSVALRMTSSWYKVEAERRELERSRSEAELQNLKSQLNPHFLFNTLNNIYSLIAISPERAQEVVHDLSRLLRYVLYESSESYVTVGKDLEFLRNYIELMRIRLPEHVKVKTDIQTSSPETQIAPLLFITLVENAFKHGVSNNKPSFIDIEIKADDKRVICNIRNSHFPKDYHDKSGSGIGIPNLRKRLDLIYANRYSSSYEQKKETYHYQLEIKLS